MFKINEDINETKVSEHQGRLLNRKSPEFPEVEQSKRLHTQAKQQMKRALNRDRQVYAPDARGGISMTAKSAISISQDPTCSFIQNTSFFPKNRVGADLDNSYSLNVLPHLRTAEQLDYQRAYEGKKLLDDDYDEAFVCPSKDDDKEYVKILDKWRLENKRRKMLSSEKPITSFEPVQQNNIAVDEIGDPTVNLHAINHIFVDSDSDEENTKRRNELRPTTEKEGASQPQINGLVKPLKVVEMSVTENNQNIVHSLITRKVHEQLKDIDIHGLSMSQLKSHIRNAIEQILIKFRTLKGTFSETLIQNQIELMIKKIKGRNNEINVVLDTQGQDAKLIEQAKHSVDYPLVEESMMKHYEQTIEDIEMFSTRLTPLNHESFQLKRELAIEKDKLSKLDARYSDNPREATEVTDGSGKTKKGKKKEVRAEHQDSAADFIKLQKIRAEKKRQETVITEKIMHLEARLLPLTREIENAEQGLKAAIDDKEYYRLQLKELYFRLLKDDRYLIETKNNASYVYVLKSLWRIEDAASEQAFPVYLEPHSIKFLTKYAKAQFDVENFCKRHNLLGMIAHIEDYQYLSLIKKDQFGEKQLISEQKNSSPTLDKRATPFKNTEVLLEDVRNRLHDIKKLNLKAKKLTSHIQYNGKGRLVVTKWEDCNPFDWNSEPILPSKNAIQKSESQHHTILGKLRLDGDLEISSGEHHPEITMKLLENIDTMKKTEMERMIKEYIHEKIDEKKLFNIQKAFWFVFGKRDGTDAFKRFSKEKRTFDEKISRSNFTFKKSQSVSQVSLRSSPLPFSSELSKPVAQSAGLQKNIRQTPDKLQVLPSIKK